MVGVVSLKVLRAAKKVEDREGYFTISQVSSELRMSDNAVKSRIIYLMKRGYIVRVDRGCYKLTKKALEIVKKFE